MDFKTAIPIFLVVALFGYGGYRVRESFKGNAAVQTEKRTNENVDTSLTKKSLSDFLRAPRKDYKEALGKNATIPADCVDYFDQLEQIDMMTFKQPESTLTFQQLPVRPEKCQFSDSAYDAAQKAFNEKCLGQETSPNAVVSEECGSALYFVRASITRLLLKDKPIAEIKDLSKLTDLLFSEFQAASVDGHSFDSARLREIGQQMLNRNSNLFVAAKVVNFADILDGINSLEKKDPKSDEVWARAATSLNRARAMNPQDPDMDDLEMVVSTQGMNPDKALTYSKALVAKDANNSKGYYVQAYSEWKNSHQNESMESLKHAMDLDPKNEEYAQIYQAITTPGSTIDSFRMPMKFGISSKDFDP